MVVVAFVTDLMFRSKLAHAVSGITFARDPAEARGADVIVVDLGHHAALVAAAREAAPGARIVCFGSHVEADVLEQARRDGADEALPRSRFFADPAAAVAGRQISGQG